MPLGVREFQEKLGKKTGFTIQANPGKVLSGLFC
jgi:hypothetical protein